MQSMPSELLSARDAARQLGIKRDSLYAYVSRGLLQSVALPGSRERWYRAEDVARFRAGRGGERAREALMPVIDTAISSIENGRFFYRGKNAVALADRAALEDVAALLWGAAPEESAAAAPETDAESGGDGLFGLIERCQTRLAALSAADMAALDLTRAGVVRTGSRILSALAGCIAPGSVGRGPVHRRLAAHWGLDEAGADLLRRCLVLLADHELNASTFVARCVASTGATPYAAVSAALGALSGRR